ILVIGALPLKAKQRVVFGREAGASSAHNEAPCGAFFYASGASLNRFMSMVDHSHHNAPIKYIF
ncbi:hypothetical protein Q6298_29075, partial [Klebsiella pneumoniae]|uniref:hypothetical protein n=1 Tax=Klebsiella pneumoniae TaxID=573 RepID=UPI002731AC5A